MNAILRRTLVFVVLLSLAVAAQADETDKPGVVKLKQTVTVSVVESLRDQIRSRIDNVPEGADAKIWKEDWLQILKGCEALEIEITDVRKLNLEAKTLEYVDTSKPEIRVLLPITEDVFPSRLNEPGTRMLSCITARISIAVEQKGKQGEITSKRLVVGLGWSEANKQRLRQGVGRITNWNFDPFTITIDPSK